jgi:1-phosphatidylinositol-4-phosphate 5-kinase
MTSPHDDTDEDDDDDDDGGDYVSEARPGATRRGSQAAQPPSRSEGRGAATTAGQPGFASTASRFGTLSLDAFRLNSTEDPQAGPTVPFMFIDYAPMCFRHIRHFLGIENKSFYNVLCESKWHSIPTPGKSSAQLFFCGQNWVIKTMTGEESDFLRAILHRYYNHVRDNPHTLLPHFVGHHRLTFKDVDGNSRTLTVVVMQNVFATPNKVHEKFDLKGSTVARFAKPEERRKLTCTKKDLDICEPLRIGHARRAVLLDQMHRDCEFLRRCSIMDYSFLIGIHRRLPSSAPPPLVGPPAAVPAEGVPERALTADEGGMMSVGGGEIYYCGIIDILQEYNLWKRSETFVRGVQYDRRHISSVEPREYADRFENFMAGIIV